MNVIIQKIVIAIFLLLFVLVGCSGGTGADSPSTTTDKPAEETNGPGVLFEDIDEEALLNNPPNSVVKTVSNNALIDVTPTTSPKVELSSVEIISEAPDGSSISLVASSNISQSNVDQPLFIDGVFKGIITGIQDAATDDITIGLRNAENISEVYDSFDVTFRNDEFRNNTVRAISSAVAKGGLGRYDHLNDTPLGVSIIDKRVPNGSRSVTSNEVVLRIDIPEGYHVPIQPRGLTCSFLEADCTMTMQSDAKNRVKMEAEHKRSGVTFSTKGSYIEIGLGSYIKAHYDRNPLSADLFEFELAQSAYFESNIVVSVSGEVSSSWSTQLDLLYDFEVEIAHPYSLVAKTSVIIDPNIIFGVDGKMKGALSASSKLKRSGEIKFKYSSANNTKEESNNIKYTPKNITEDGVSVAIEAEGHAYIMPALTMLPSLKFLRVNIPITFVFIRSGVKFDNEIKGIINPNFVVETSGNIKEGSGTAASLTTSLYGLVQGRWFVRAAGINFYTKGYKDLFKTGALNIIEWKTQQLNSPKITIEDHVAGRSKKNITFSIDADKKIEPHIYYYYSVGDINNPPSDISVQNIENHTPYWKSGDGLIAIDSNSTVKVRAVLHNEDVSTSNWSWGISVSQQKSFDVVDIMAPVATPYSQSFEGELGITIEQSDGFDIYYTLNDAPSVKYEGPFMISEDTTLVTHASGTFNGKKVQSKTATYVYHRCADNEVLKEEECQEINPLENVVSITASNDSVAEASGDSATFTFTRTGDTSEALTISYLISGSADPGDDYNDKYLWGDITIPAGNTSTDFLITPVDDTTQEGTETVIFTIIANSNSYSLGTPTEATVNIYELPEVSVTATDAEAAESGGRGEFTITRTGDTSEALTVYFTLSGSATLGTDYTVSQTTPVTIPAGTESMTIVITAIDDNDAEGTETVTLTVIKTSDYVLATRNSDNVAIKEQSNIYKTDTALNAVWAWSNDSAIAAGVYSSEIDGYKIYRYDGDNWSESIASLPDYGTITDLWGTSENNVYAVTKGPVWHTSWNYHTGGKVLHYNGVSWSALSGAPFLEKNSFRSIWGANATNIFVTGINGISSPVVYRFDGFGWSRDWMDGIIDVNSTINDIHGNATGSIYFVADYPGDFIIKLSGSEWVGVDEPDTTSFWNSQFSGIWVAPNNRVFMSGYNNIVNYDSDNNLWEATNVKELTSAEGYVDIPKVWGTTNNDVYAIANRYSSTRFSNSLLLYYNGTSWSEKALPKAESTYIRGISGVDDLFIVGQQLGTEGGGVIIHYTE